MKLILLCGLLCFVAVMARSGKYNMWIMRPDTFVHRTFDNESPDAHYYYLRVTRSDILKPGKENLHIIVNEISDPEANIKLYVKSDVREELKDLAAEGVQEFATRHAEFVLKMPSPPKEEFSIAVVCDKVGVEYSVSACMGEECSETSTNGLTAQPRRPKFPLSVRRVKYMAEKLKEMAEEKQEMTEKRAFPPPPGLIVSPMGATTPLSFIQTATPMSSFDKSGVVGGFIDGEEFAPACMRPHGLFTVDTYFHPLSPFLQINAPPSEIIYEFAADTLLDGICLWAGGVADPRITTITIAVAGMDMMFTDVVTDFAVRPPLVVDQAEEGITIDFPAVMPTTFLRISASGLSPQGIMLIGEVAGRVVPDPAPIVTRCFGTNCQCSIPNCEASPPSAMDCACAACLAFDNPSCTAIEEELDPITMAPINRGNVRVPNMGCLRVSTLVNNIVGTTGRDCLFLEAGAQVEGNINMGDQQDCIINRGATILGTTNLADGDDCYIEEAPSLTGRINGGNDNDFIALSGGSTDSTGPRMHLTGGPGNDCISVTDGIVGRLLGGDGDDCIFVNSGSETLRISGGADQDHIGVSESFVDEDIRGDAGDDIIQTDLTETVISITGGDGHDEVYLDMSFVDGNIVTAAGNDIVVLESMSDFGGVNTGEGNDCIDMTQSMMLIPGDVINGGLGDDQIFASGNVDMGNILGGDGCDLIQSCANGANVGIGPIAIVNGGAEEDLCFVDVADQVLNCEMRGNGVPTDCQDPRLTTTPPVMP